MPKHQNERNHSNSIENDLPVRYNLMIKDALCAVKNEDFRKELFIIATDISKKAWNEWLCNCGPEDNRQEHEWIVFANVMRIAEKENLDLSNRRIATAFAFLHDSYRISDRKMESDNPNPEEKRIQRRKHMICGALIARKILRSLKHPEKPNQLLLNIKEANLCIDIIKNHDSWKLDPPKPFATNNILAVLCVEADALWPLHPIGVLADIERANVKILAANKSEAANSFVYAGSWESKLLDSLKTLTHHYRPKWEKVGIPKSDFKDGESIFRTEEGFRLYREWRIRWNI